MGTSFVESMPPGFGFHPTDVELISHYLKRKIMGCQSGLEVIPEVDIYKYEPWDLPEKSLIRTRDPKWHFFTSRDKKYPNGFRANRATKEGYWKSTGKDRNIRSNNRIIGTKKTLVFHQGRPPYGKRTEWIMHEFYLNDDQYNPESMKDIFVLCRITKRNTITLEEEEEEAISPQETKNKSQPLPVTYKNNTKNLENIFIGMMPKQEIPSPSAHVDDFDSWLAELSDDNIQLMLPPSQPSKDHAVSPFHFQEDQKDILQVAATSRSGDRNTPEEANVFLAEEFLGFDLDPEEIDYNLMFEDYGPLLIDSVFDYDSRSGLSQSDYDVNPIFNSELSRFELQVHKSMNAAPVNRTFLEPTSELHTRVVDCYVEEEKPVIREKKSSLISFPLKGEDSCFRERKIMRGSRRERISRRCRDYIRKARRLVTGVRLLLRKSSVVGLNYVLWLSYVIGMAMMMAFLMVINAARALYGSCH